MGRGLLRPRIELVSVPNSICGEDQATILPMAPWCLLAPVWAVLPVGAAQQLRLAPSYDSWRQHGGAPVYYSLRRSARGECIGRIKGVDSTIAHHHTIVLR
jgi:hypothetical protein